MKVIIVGGGIAGLSSALYLRELGADVSLYEKQMCGGGTTWAAAGFLAPVHEVDFQKPTLLQAGQESLKLYSDWEVKLGDIGMNKTGTLELALGLEDVDYLRRLFDFQLNKGLKVEWLGGKQLRELEPNLSVALPAGILCKDDIQLDNRLLADNLREYCLAIGVEILEDTEIEAFEINNDKIEVYNKDLGNLGCDKLLLTTGVFGNQLIEKYVKVFPIKGQMLSLEVPLEGLVTHSLRFRSRIYGYGYLLPKTDRLVLGTTVEEMGMDEGMTAGAALDILRRAYLCVPSIYDLNIIETWSGFRPATLDRLPVLDKLPDSEVYILNGLYRNGILLAPLMGKATAEFMVHNHRTPLIESFSLKNRSLI